MIRISLGPPEQYVRAIVDALERAPFVYVDISRALGVVWSAVEHSLHWGCRVETVRDGTGIVLCRRYVRTRDIVSPAVEYDLLEEDREPAGYMDVAPMLPVGAMTSPARETIERVAQQQACAYAARARPGDGIPEDYAELALGAGSRARRLRAALGTIEREAMRRSGEARRLMLGAAHGLRYTAHRAEDRAAWLLRYGPPVTDAERETWRRMVRRRA